MSHVKNSKPVYSNVLRRHWRLSVLCMYRFECVCDCAVTDRVGENKCNYFK